MDIHVYCPIKNIPMQHSSSADPAASTSKSLAKLLVSKSLSSDDHLESVVSDSEECSRDNIYTIKKILFVSQGLIGHGTICYLASWNEEDYIVKDHWVLGKQDDIILNKIEILKLMHGVPGVLELVDYWLITTSEGEVNNTQSYHKRECQSMQGTSCTHVRLILKLCACPLHIFQMLKELARVLRDIVIIQKMVVEECKILHRDCNLNNAMILGNLDISKGFLIDWEFAVHITADNKYTIGGTGTVPIMSCRLLSQVSLLQQQAKAEAENKKLSKTHKSKLKKTPAPKTSLDSLALPVSHVTQVHQEHMSNSLLNHWTSLDLASCAAFKIAFFMNPLDEEHLLNKFHLYFKPLISLAKDWCAVLKDNMVHPVTFDTILHILNTHLNQLPDDEELQSTMAMLKKSATVLNSTSNLKCAASISLQPVGQGTLKWKKLDDI
ncbi:uncharacterized protein BJ212DRAFT_1305039 [Suillus subaureus]|uniref:Fungal-type protein kinase domain-containing protein n=1 Tax=Suillus subaureus TaxID=48587 RepID=A0A9P7DRN3_9AGAM|nr:uncharacterized protein BJ212DRAFT_1305039 [Suillus subaureus]KAG1801288.1 hypothetical protein BJ212DRAFT_1305039 [Suillus subaureus]